MESLYVNEFGELIEPLSGMEIHGMYSDIEKSKNLLSFFKVFSWDKYRIPITFSILES